MRDSCCTAEPRRPPHPPAEASRGGSCLRSSSARGDPARGGGRSMNTRVFDTAADAITALARLLLQRASGQPEISIGISGGSTPKPLYELLGRDPRIREHAVTWVVVDERYVPSADELSNARMIRETLFRDGV